MMEIHHRHDEIAKEEGEGREIPDFTVMHREKLKRPGHRYIAEALIKEF